MVRTKRTRKRSDKEKGGNTGNKQNALKEKGIGAFPRNFENISTELGQIGGSGEEE